MKERNLKLDNAKGILITLVVIGHMLLPIQGTTRGVTNFFYMIYAFHMPAFVFISCFSSSCSSRRSRLTAARPASRTSSIPPAHPGTSSPCSSGTG